MKNQESRILLLKKKKLKNFSVWYKVSKAINELDYEEADIQKNLVEETEREKRKKFPQEFHQQKLFKKQEDGEFIFKK